MLPPAQTLQPGVFYPFTQPNGASIPTRSVANHPEATILPSEAPRASQSRFALRWDATKRSHPVTADSFRRSVVALAQAQFWSRDFFRASVRRP